MLAICFLTLSISSSLLTCTVHHQHYTHSSQTFHPSVQMRNTNECAVLEQRERSDLQLIKTKGFDAVGWKSR